MGRTIYQMTSDFHSHVGNVAERDYYYLLCDGIPFFFLFQSKGSYSTADCAQRPTKTRPKGTIRPFAVGRVLIIIVIIAAVILLHVFFLLFFSSPSVTWWLIVLARPWAGRPNVWTCRLVNGQTGLDRHGRHLYGHHARSGNFHSPAQNVDAPFAYLWIKFCW